MTSKERLDTLLQYQSDIFDSCNPKEIEIKSKIFDSWYSKIVNDLEMLELITKHLKIENDCLKLVQITQDDFNKDKQELIKIKDYLKDLMR